MNITIGLKSRLLTTLLTTLGLMLVFNGMATTSRAQAPARASDRQVENIIRSIETRTDKFRKSFDAALDRSRLDGTYREDNLNQYVQSFEEATNDLRSRFNGRTAMGSDIENVLNRASMIDQFMKTNLKQRRVQSDWTVLKRDLQKLANAYGVALNLNGRAMLSPVVTAQIPYRVSDQQVEVLLKRIEQRSNTFRADIDKALDRSRFDGSDREDNVNEYIKDFENLTDVLRRKFDDRSSVALDVSNVIVRGVRIDDFMKQNLRRETAVQREWRNLRSDINLLASYYSLAFNLDNRRNLPAYVAIVDPVFPNADARFTGTYRLNMQQSENARAVAGRYTSGLNRNIRDRIFDNLVRRLESPAMLAVQRRGMQVMLASTRSPQMTLDVDGMLHAERYPNGKPSSVRTTFSGDTLTVVSNGDRANDFTAVFTALDGGRRMMVTRSIYAEQLSQPVTVKSFYDRIEETARFNIYRNGNDSRPTTIGSNGGYFVARNSTLLATLNRDISTKTVRDGDRFTMTVSSPLQYAGAVIEGYISNPNRSGRISGRSELTLNYETIRLNNQTYRFSGITENVRSVSGQSVRIDNEGTVKDSDNQTSQTIGRTAIGAGIGALLGAILGGGEGAAIGAGVGAGAGIGSVYIQGRDDLELKTGAEFTILATGFNS